eukprot:NODE_12230_length_1237_cov_10.014414.p1 GENE.NODE_12230_length_1237_cov_10.014414~~NODE_12230_length_1237_cov_10.014414.p1  ORF type:complete len:175 (-),score=33.94 NODE_12230_length_1237_cov_10.014414:286-810(-)
MGAGAAPAPKEAPAVVPTPTASAESCQRAASALGWNNSSASLASAGPPPQRPNLLAGFLCEDAAERDARFDALDTPQLAAVEAALEASLNAARDHRQRRLERQLHSVQRRHREEHSGRQLLEDLQVCVICSELEKTVVFLPCRHLCACKSCAEQVSLCPICRAPIDGRVQCIRP